MIILQIVIDITIIRIIIIISFIIIIYISNIIIWERNTFLDFLLILVDQVKVYFSNICVLK